MLRSSFKPCPLEICGEWDSLKDFCSQGANTVTSTFLLCTRPDSVMIRGNSLKNELSLVTGIVSDVAAAALLPGQPEEDLFATCDEDPAVTLVMQVEEDSLVT